MRKINVGSNRPRKGEIHFGIKIFLFKFENFSFLFKVKWTGEINGPI